MSGVLSVLIQHYDIRYGQGVPGEVCRAVHIEPGINAFQIVLRRQRGGINLLIVLRLHGKTVVTDGIQRLKAVVPRTISRFQLIDGEGVALRRPRLLHDSSGRLHIACRLRRILPFCLFRKSQHFVNTGLLRVLQTCLDLRRVKIKKFLIARGILELFNLRRKIVLLRLPQRRQLFIQSGNAPCHQVFVEFLLGSLCLRVFRRILRITLPEKLVHVKGDIHSPLGFFFFGKIILEGHYPVLVGDTAALTVIILMEAIACITHIALIREGAVFLQRNVPAVGLIVDVILQMLWHLHNVQFFDVIAAQIVIVMDIGVNLIAIQILGEVDDLLQAAAMVAHFHTGLKLCVFAFAHFIQLRCQIIQLVQTLIFTQLTVKTVHIAVIVRDEPFLIGLAEVILLADPDPLKHFFQFLGGGGKLHPLAHKLALIVLPKIGDKGGKGIVLIVIVIWHVCPSLSFFRKFQLKIDVLAARVIQDHRSVISGLFLFRPHSLDIGATLFQKVRCHLLCQLLLAARLEAVIFPEDETAGPIRTRKVLLALINRLAAAGAGTDHFLLRGKQLFAILGNAGIGGHDLLNHRADTVHECIRVSAALCDLRQFLFPFRRQHGRGQRLRQDCDKVDTGFCGDQALALALHKSGCYQLFDDSRPGRRRAKPFPLRLVGDTILACVLHSGQEGIF